MSTNVSRAFHISALFTFLTLAGCSCGGAKLSPDGGPFDAGRDATSDASDGAVDGDIDGAVDADIDADIDASGPLTGCGDGLIRGSEVCDDSNVAPGDGCNAQCQVEAGWVCPTMAGACAAAGCGDGIVAGRETCDDGNTTLFDGCTDRCQLEAGAGRGRRWLLRDVSDA